MHGCSYRVSWIDLSHLSCSFLIDTSPAASLGIKEGEAHIIRNAGGSALASFNTAVKKSLISLQAGCLAINLDISASPGNNWHSNLSPHGLWHVNVHNWTIPKFTEGQLNLVHIPNLKGVLTVYIIIILQDKHPAKSKDIESIDFLTFPDLSLISQMLLGGFMRSKQERRVFFPTVYFISSRRDPYELVTQIRQVV